MQNLSVSHAPLSAGLPEGAYSHTPAEAHPIDGTTESVSFARGAGGRFARR